MLMCIMGKICDIHFLGLFTKMGHKTLSFYITVTLHIF